MFKVSHWQDCRCSPNKIDGSIFTTALGWMLFLIFGDGKMRRRIGVVPRRGLRASRIYRDWHYFCISLWIYYNSSMPVEKLYSSIREIWLTSWLLPWYEISPCTPPTWAVSRLPVLVWWRLDFTRVSLRNSVNTVLNWRLGSVSLLASSSNHCLFISRIKKISQALMWIGWLRLDSKMLVFEDFVEP